MATKTALRPNRSPLRYIGGKTKIMPQLLPLMPHHHCYVSVFGGGGCDIYNKPRSAVEIYNDRHRLLVNYFAVLRTPDLRHRLCSMMEYSPCSRRLFNECLRTLANPHADCVELAHATSYINWHAYAGIDVTKATPGSFETSHTRPPRLRRKHAVAHLLDVASRFDGVVLEEQDWSAIVERYDSPNTLFYLDPPYLPGTRRSNIYAHEMSVEDHERMLDRLMHIDGYAMLSGYESKLYGNRLSHWRRKRIKTRAWTSSSTEKPRRTEIVWMNFRTDGRRIN